ncbi:MAG: tandem-95 repeat protein [Nanoarchaeota archaeon]|nr:tandem-95 repeat protein [Nanoarchaeota archaeon]
MKTKKNIGSYIFVLIVMMLLVSSSSLAQVNWLKGSNGENYLAWDNGTKSKEITVGQSATLYSGYFFSTLSSSVHMTVRLNSVATGKTVSTLVDKNVNTQKMGYETITINQNHYNNQEGEYLVVIKLTDANSELVDTSLYLKVKPKINLNFNPNKKPVMDPPEDQEVYENEKLTFSVLATDLNKNDHLSYEAQKCTLSYFNLCLGSSPLPAGAVFENKTLLGVDYGKFTWTPDYDFVKHPELKKTIILKFRAYDGKEYSGWEFVKVLVKDVNKIPSFDEIGNKIVDKKELIKFTIVGHDYDDDVLIYGADNLPAGAALDSSSGIFQWIPKNSQLGEHYITFWVKDNYGGYSSENVKITVTGINQAPIAKDDFVKIDKNTPVMISVLDNDNDPDGDNLILTGVISDASSAVNGMKNIIGDEIEYLPYPDFVGLEKFIYTISDGVGGSASAEVTVRVVDPDDNNTLILEPIGNKEVYETEVLEFNIKATEPGASLTFSVDNLPSGADLIDNGDGTAAFFWIPNENQQGLYLVTFKVTDGTLEDSETIMITVKEKNDGTPQCSDQLDNDGDGLVDLNDPGCSDLSDDDETNSSSVPQCNDGIDNDGDGLVDLNDPGCSDLSDDDETNSSSVPQCKDGIDNDGDGLVDLNDPGCDNLDDDDETDEDNQDPLPENHNPAASDDYAQTKKNTPVEICVLTNDLDQDNDTLTLIPNSVLTNNKITINGDCLTYTPSNNFLGVDSFTYEVTDNKGGYDSATVIVEVTEIKKQCSDGIDNDGDGLIDFPYDPGCNNSNDDDEFNEEIKETFLTPPSYSLKFTAVKFDKETVQPGSDVILHVNVNNAGTSDLSKLKIKVAIYDLGSIAASSSFNLNSSGSISKNLLVAIPYDAKEGLYLAKVTVGNDHYHHQAYRWILVK